MTFEEIVKFCKDREKFAITQTLKLNNVLFKWRTKGIIKKGILNSMKRAKKVQIRTYNPEHKYYISGEEAFQLYKEMT